MSFSSACQWLSTLSYRQQKIKTAHFSLQECLLQIHCARRYVERKERKKKARPDIPKQTTSNTNNNNNNKRGGWGGGLGGGAESPPAAKKKKYCCCYPTLVFAGSFFKICQSAEATAQERSELMQDRCSKTAVLNCDKTSPVITARATQRGITSVQDRLAVTRRHQGEQLA